VYHGVLECIYFPLASLSLYSASQLATSHN